MSVRLSASEQQKADKNLLAALEKADATDPLRVIMLLQAPSQTRESAEISAGPDRVAIRKALIAEQQAHNQAAFGESIAAIKAMDLTVYGGQTTRALVAEGSAAGVAKALALPGVKHAALDQAVRTIGDAAPPSQKAPVTKKQPAKKRVATIKKNPKASVKSSRAAAAKKRR